MKTTRPADFTDVRATNLAVVLHHLRAHGPSSRAAIAASTGLTKATVSSLTGTLIEQRLLRETGLTGNRIGRPSTALALDGSAYAAIGLQITADRLTALAVDFAGDQLLLWHRTFDGGPATGRRAFSSSGGREVSGTDGPEVSSAGAYRRDGGQVVDFDGRLINGGPDAGRITDGLGSGLVTDGRAVTHGLDDSRAPHGSHGGRAPDASIEFDDSAGLHGSGRAVSAIIALAQRAATRVRQQGRHVLGLTVAVPGLVEEDGLIRLSPSLGWSGVDLRGRLAASLRQPDLEIIIGNQAGLAALAELRHHHRATPSRATGPAHTSRPAPAATWTGLTEVTDLTYVTGTAGIEAGIIVDGRPLRGSRGFTGQIGQFTLGPAGSPTLADLAGIESLVRRALPGFDPESLADLAPAVEQVALLARSGDPAVLTALQETGCHLGRGLALLTNLVDPEVIVLGDHYATLAEWLIPAASTELTQHTLAPSTGNARLITSRLGLHAAALGGALSHLNHIDAGNPPPKP